MNLNRTIPVQCPKCATAYQVTVTVIVDTSHNPFAKDLLLSGQLNVVRCPHCQLESAVAVPLVYHDSHSAKLITFAPVAIGLNQTESNRILDALMKDVAKTLAQEQDTSYFFRPTHVGTMAELVQAVLAADGITAGMVEQQQLRSRLVMMFLQCDEDSLIELVKQYNSQLDEGFFQMLTVAIQQLVTQGNVEVAEHLTQVQQTIAQHSTVGRKILGDLALTDQKVQQVASLLNTLGDSPSQSALMQVVLAISDDVEQLHAFVGLAHPLFDEAFFQQVATEISAELAQQIREMKESVENHHRQQIKHRLSFLQQLIVDDDPERLMRAGGIYLDRLFMELLQQLQQTNTAEIADKLSQIEKIALKIMDARMTPEMRYLSQLLDAETDAQIHSLLQKAVQDFGVKFLGVLDDMAKAYRDNGEGDVAEQLVVFRQIADTIWEQHND